MRDFVDHLKDQNLDRCAPRSDRSDVADIWQQLGVSEGFSIEWIFDRFEQTEPRTGRRM